MARARARARRPRAPPRAALPSLRDARSAVCVCARARACRYGLCISHNGNLTNASMLKHSVEGMCRHINTNSDSELLLNIFSEVRLPARALAARPWRPTLTRGGSDAAPSVAQSLAKVRSDPADDLDADAIFYACSSVFKKCIGGYAVAVLINDVGVVVFRDPLGIRPIVYGAREQAHGLCDYAVASESVAIDTITCASGDNFDIVRDVFPGEAVFFPKGGRPPITRTCVPGARLCPCLFEYVYFARPDSIMDGVPVYEARLRMGDNLAARIKRLLGSAWEEIDVVIPVPDTARTSALSLAYSLDRPYREGFIKNRYIARTFIMPGQAARKKGVRVKLNTIKSEFKGRVRTRAARRCPGPECAARAECSAQPAARARRAHAPPARARSPHSPQNVLLVDDSIVRGTTSREIVQMARDAGANKVFFSSAAPAVRYPNVYGIDIPTKSELIANGREEAEIARLINADWVVYQDLDDLKSAVQDINPVLKGCTFEGSVFDGKYLTGDIGEEYFAVQEARRLGQSVSNAGVTFLTSGAATVGSGVRGNAAAPVASPSNLSRHNSLMPEVAAATLPIRSADVVMPSGSCDSLYNQKASSSPKGPTPVHNLNQTLGGLSAVPPLA